TLNDPAGLRVELDEVGTTSAPDPFRANVLRRVSDVLVDVLQPAVNFEFFADVCQDLETEAGNAAFERISMDSQQLERLEGVGEGQPAFKIDRNFMERRGDAELRGALVEQGPDGQGLTFVAARHEPNPGFAKPVAEYPQNLRHEPHAKLRLLFGAGFEPFPIKGK